MNQISIGHDKQSTAIDASLIGNIQVISTLEIFTHSYEIYTTISFSISTIGANSQNVSNSVITNLDIIIPFRIVQLISTMMLSSSSSEAYISLRELLREDCIPSLSDGLFSVEFETSFVDSKEGS